MIRNEIKIGDVWTHSKSNGDGLWRWMVVGFGDTPRSFYETCVIETVDFNYMDQPGMTVKSTWVVSEGQIERGEYILISRLDDNK